MLPVCLQQEHLLLSREILERQGLRLGATIVPSVLHLDGPLDYERAQRALQEIVERHAALRVRFFPTGAEDPAERGARLDAFARSGVCPEGLYQQEVLEGVPVALPVVDLSNGDLSDCTAEEREAELRRRIQEEAAYAFGDRRPPYLRGTLVRLSAKKHYLLLNANHLVCDAWSMGILRREFAADLPPAGERRRGRR